MSNRQEQRVLHLADGAFTESPDDTPAAPEGRVRSTMRRVGLHLVNSASDLVGDDIGGRVVRRFLIQMAGGRVARTSHLLGGTRFTRPMNLRVGNRCLINRNCYLDLHGPLTIGDDVVIGHGTSIITSQHRVGPSTRRAGSVVPRPVRIFSGAWIGADAVILPGVTVGVGAIVAAGAVVTSDVAPDTVVAGVPARFVRQLGN